MASTPDQPQQGQTGSSWLQVLTQRSRETAYVLFGVCGALALVGLWLAFKRDGAYASTIVWLAALALVALAGAVYQLVREPQREEDRLDNSRLLVLLLGGLGGLATFFLGLWRAWEALDLIMAGLEEWRKQWVTLGIILLAVYGGLAVMFIALQLARVDERSRPWLRRWLYGTNAVLSLLLLAAILGFVNVIASARWGRYEKYNFFNKTFDWTSSTMYSLSDASKSQLRALDSPVKVYVLMTAEASLAQAEIQTLLDNCRSVTEKIEVETISPDLNRKRVMELEAKYQIPSDEGMLLVYGSGENNEVSEFIRFDELFGEATPRSGDEGDTRRRFKFKGESALMSKLTYLMEGKTRPVVYFTQGHGELDLNSMESTPNQGLGQLRSWLARGNYEVRDLPPGMEKIPEDAAVVVIARPTLSFAKTEIDALRSYLEPGGTGTKKGKLIALLEPTAREGAIVNTGIEDFLREYNVQVNNNRILNVSPQFGYTDVLVMAKPDSPNAIARGFMAGDVPKEVFLFDDVRTVEQKQDMGGAPPMRQYLVETVIQTLPPAIPQNPIILQTDLRADPLELVRDLRKRENLQALRTRMGKVPQPVAVAVSEAPGFHLDPDAPRQPRPRLIVFGDATWITNRVLMDERMGGKSHRDLFRSCLSWLRERADIGAKAEDKERTVFVLKSQEVVSRLQFQPALLTLLGIATLGTGIWVVRRR